MKKFLFASMACVALFTACKKDDPVVEKTTAQKLIGKWGVNSVIDNYHSGNISNRDTTYGTAADYVEFRNDSKVFTKIDGDTSTSYYSVSTDNKLIIDGSASEIKTLTENQLIIYGKEVINTTDYYEFTLNLKK